MVARGRRGQLGAEGVPARGRAARPQPRGPQPLRPLQRRARRAHGGAHPADRHRQVAQRARRRLLEPRPPGQGRRAAERRRLALAAHRWRKHASHCWERGTPVPLIAVSHSRAKTRHGVARSQQRGAANARADHHLRRPQGGHAGLAGAHRRYAARLALRRLPAGLRAAHVLRPCDRGAGQSLALRSAAHRRDGDRPIRRSSCRRRWPSRRASSS